MGQQAYRAFEPLIDTATERSWWPGSRQDSENEATYCGARAEGETERAREAVHPAARDAHLKMAALYQQRALVARQLEDPAIQDWMSEGGSWLADA
jgi:hypothetical protein